jgi:bacillithiol system protein YtxJ
MSFLSGLHGMMRGNKPTLSEKWRLPDSASDIDEIFKKDIGIQIIYKHSFSCGVSMFAKLKLDEVMKEASDEAEFYLIDVRQNRDASNLVAELTGIRHESPQVIVIKSGEIIWHGSHGAIDEAVLMKYIEI